MIKVLFNPILIYATLYGITMKIADLLDEHGLKWFKGSDILFGFLWGIFGILLIIGNDIIANIVLAMNLAFIIRNRLDYLNHQIGSSIIIISFLLFAKFNFNLFLIFYLIFLIFGSLKDYIDDILVRKNKKKKDLFYHLNESMLYYPIPTFIYSLITKEWIVFYAFLLYTIAYNLTKNYYHKKFTKLKY